MNPEVDRLYRQLKTVQEPRGFPFNTDMERVSELLEALLVNKERYGYMVCPCRLATGERARDKDILCPCAYREEDVVEYGSCYCGLYATRDWSEGKVPHRYIPERRPAEKMGF